MTDRASRPQLQETIKDLVPFLWNKVTKVAHCTMNVDVLRQPMKAREANRARISQMGMLRMLDKKILDDIIRRIVEVAQPEKIILFGSAARDGMGPHSDVDLLIIKEGAAALELMGEIYMNLDGVGVAVDAVVVTPGDVERYRNSHAGIIKPALREGRVVYEAA